MQEYSSDPLLALIKERGLIDDLQYEEVVQEQGRTAKPISQILADFGLVDIDTQLQVMAESLGTEVVTLDGMEFPPELKRTARSWFCKSRVESITTQAHPSVINPWPLPYRTL